ncbi:hypothetical protein BJ170DRAFT_678313 [Xylariales sp. AK1849]|nr:hypothetical protein BJ170DRAFT_678313 [Xylariales sp. AK1849]
MRFFSTLVAALAVAQGVVAAGPQKSIIVTYPSGVSTDIVNRAMDEIRKAGGTITHEYNLIKGFAAKATETSIQSLSAWSTEYGVHIEDDQTVQIS